MVVVLKRRYGNRPDWKRIIKRDYAQSYFDTEEFRGYVCLLHTVEVREPLHVNYGEKKLCIVDDGYWWLQQFPSGEKYCVTTMFDADGEIVQWYIDICLETGLEEGIPWMDDLFLDIIVLPSGEHFLVDVDELDDALNKGVIDRADYELAWDEAKRLMKLIEKREFGLLDLAEEHKRFFIDKE
ncbi:DUF402 domain-containing protein [Ornithinibacillus contaminans]|uniref:DUF402 domain-containing protein n=1 Tax=Ornithinibacillus contaminans TaxID=694055 RepID=UPI00064DEE62|nr:DUF402 domain-containing protein [Ornithinibacillus contaminans]